MFTSTDAPVKHITEPKKGIPCKHYLLPDAVVFIDHRHKKRKENKRKLCLIIIITLKVTPIFFVLFAFDHPRNNEKKKRENDKSIVKRQQNIKTNCDILCFIATY